MVIAPDTYMNFEEATQWSIDNLMHSKGQDKHTSHLQMASAPNSYSVPTYFHYVPNKIMESDKYLNIYLAKHQATYNTLTEEMITDDLDEHSRLVHGIMPINLKALPIIEVDTKQPISLYSALHIEQTSPQEQDKILNGIYTRPVARGVVIKSTNMANSDLNDTRSNEFLKVFYGAEEYSKRSRFKIRFPCQVARN